METYQPTADEEKALYESHLQRLDPKGSGVLNTEEVVELLRRSRLSTDFLREIWKVACMDGTRLGKSNLYLLLRCVALAQSNCPFQNGQWREYNMSAVLRLPKFDEAEQISHSAPNNESNRPLSVRGNPPSSQDEQGNRQAQQQQQQQPPQQQQQQQQQLPQHHQQQQRAGSFNGRSPWALSAQNRAEYDKIFLAQSLSPEGKLDGKEAESFFSQSKLDRGILRQVWNLSDIDRDGKLSKEEFMVAMHLVRCCSKLNVLAPQELPTELVATAFADAPPAAAAAAAAAVSARADQVNANMAHMSIPRQSVSPALSVDSAGTNSVPGTPRSSGVFQPLQTNPGAVSRTDSFSVPRSPARTGSGRMLDPRYSQTPELQSPSNAASLMAQATAVNTAAAVNASLAQRMNTSMDAEYHRLETDLANARKNLEATNQMLDASNVELENLLALIGQSREALNSTNMEIEEKRQQVTEKQTEVEMKRGELFDLRQEILDKQRTQITLLSEHQALCKMTAEANEDITLAKNYLEQLDTLPQFPNGPVPSGATLQSESENIPQANTDSSSLDEPPAQSTEDIKSSANNEASEQETQFEQPLSSAQTLSEAQPPVPRRQAPTRDAPKLDKPVSLTPADFSANEIEIEEESSHSIPAVIITEKDAAPSLASDESTNMPLTEEVEITKSSDIDDNISNVAQASESFDHPTSSNIEEPFSEELTPPNTVGLKPPARPAPSPSLEEFPGDASFNQSLKPPSRTPPALSPSQNPTSQEAGEVDDLWENINTDSVPQSTPNKEESSDTSNEKTPVADFDYDPFKAGSNSEPAAEATSNLASEDVNPFSSQSNSQPDAMAAAFKDAGFDTHFDFDSSK